MLQCAITPGRTGEEGLFQIGSVCCPTHRPGCHRRRHSYCCCCCWHPRRRTSFYFCSGSFGAPPFRKQVKKVPLETNYLKTLPPPSFRIPTAQGKLLEPKGGGVGGGSREVTAWGFCGTPERRKMRREGEKKGKIDANEPSSRNGTRQPTNPFNSCKCIFVQVEKAIAWFLLCVGVPLDRKQQEL